MKRGVKLGSIRGKYKPQTVIYYRRVLPEFVLELDKKLKELKERN